MLKNKGANIGIAVFLLFVGGCSSKPNMRSLIPESKSSPEEVAEIRKIMENVKLQTVNQRNQYTFEILPQLVKIGKETTPFVIEKIVEILEAGPQKKGIMFTPQLAIIGKGITETLGLTKKYWEEWWEKNKSKYQ